MKTAFLCSSEYNIGCVYGEELTSRLKNAGEHYPIVISKQNIDEHRDFLGECEALFSTWGMEKFSEAEIRKYFPKARALFYAAGSVQNFAEEFIACSIRACSAWRANAVPVAEFTFAQIILACKGYFGSLALSQRSQAQSRSFAENHCGNYKASIGVIGAGCIGSLVCEKLKTLDCRVLICDPFISDERAACLGAQKCSLEQIFAQCDVITNHLANKPELEGIFDYNLFSLMKPNSTFINTGRGRQVNEADLARAMREDKTKTALIDVTVTDRIAPDEPLTNIDNIYITPHIAGSLSGETRRMGEYMLGEYQRLLNGEPFEHEVTFEMLKTMA